MYGPRVWGLFLGLVTVSGESLPRAMDGAADGGPSVAQGPLVTPWQGWSAVAPRGWRDPERSQGLCEDPSHCHTSSPHPGLRVGLACGSRGQAPWLTLG